MTEQRTLLGFDFETYRMAVGAVIPKAVCLGLCMEGYQPALVSNGDPDDGLTNFVHNTLCDPQYLKVGTNTAYDLAVACGNWPELIPRIFAMVWGGEVSDIIIRDKLLNLVDKGDLNFHTLPSGAKLKVDRSLAGLSKFYLGKDRDTEKKVSDSWRVNFDVLDGVPSSQYPQSALDYVFEDVEDPITIWRIQEQRRAEVWRSSGADPFVTETFRVAVNFVLFLITSWGVAIDSVEYHKILDKLREEISPEKLPLLFEHGYVRRAVLPRPYANGAKNADGTPKMTATSPESVNETKLRGYVEHLGRVNPAIRVDHTAPTAKFPQGQVSLKSEWFEEHAHLDPILEQYLVRAKLEKMFETELPRMCHKDDKGNSTGVPSPIVHANFDCLKETGRTSAYGGDLFPSFNVQNVDPRARGCYVPYEGYLLFSVDYSQMELGTLAQKCYSLFGYSVIRDMINAGVDLHEHLGAQLAYKLSPEFAGWCDQCGMGGTAEGRRKVFAQYKDHGDGKFYKHWRKFAKPTNLGYPGGLAADTFIGFARGQYDVIVDVATAKEFKAIWMQTFPEMEEYFRWINEQCVDTRNGPLISKNDQTGETKRTTLYSYMSPFGLLRSGTTYCAAANGAGLQTPAADGALLSLFNTVRACYDTSMGSILSDERYGPPVRLWGFIHDEEVGMVWDNEHAHDRVMEVARIMADGMRIITPDVKVSTTACLMRRWNKDAVPVYDANNRLVPWEPKAA